MAFRRQQNNERLIENKVVFSYHVPRDCILLTNIKDNQEAYLISTDFLPAMQKVAENSEFVIVGDEMYLNCMIIGLPSFEPLDELANVIGGMWSFHTYVEIEFGCM